MEDKDLFAQNGGPEPPLFGALLWSLLRRTRLRGRQSQVRPVKQAGYLLA
jgi:hypothetical protein